MSVIQIEQMKLQVQQSTADAYSFLNSCGGDSPSLWHFLPCAYDHCLSFVVFSLSCKNNDSLARFVPRGATHTPPARQSFRLMAQVDHVLLANQLNMKVAAAAPAALLILAIGKMFLWCCRGAWAVRLAPCCSSRSPCSSRSSTSHARHSHGTDELTWIASARGLCPRLQLLANIAPDQVDERSRGATVDRLSQVRRPPSKVESSNLRIFESD